ncbi:MAG: DNA-3-methyladenine glycosylase 2 [Gemmatimonadota bacterium]
MTLEPKSCYRALASRDPRFDGLFFVGVSTTRIYCRPICRARLPKPDRCRFFASAAAAEAEGLRRCIRCRPEKAPGRSIVDATGQLARNAATRIAGGAMNDDGLEQLAASLHTSSRQLRRAIKREYGATPVQLAQTHRLLLAKRLITESNLPMAQVAFASGFSSLRRFNALFQNRYRMSPTRIRRERDGSGEHSAQALTLALDYRPPLDWTALRDFLGSRAIPGVEAVRGDRYLRTVRLAEHRGWVAIAPYPGSASALRIEVSLSLAPVLMPVLARVRHLLDLDAEPHVIDAHLATDPLLEPAVRRRPGLRVPGTVDGFELALRAILGQQVTVRGATTLAGRFAERLGEATDFGYPELTRFTPSPFRIAEVGPERIAAIGLPRARAECICTLAGAVADGELRLEPGGGVEQTMRQLRTIRGIGAWTAEYIAMRALHWPDAFPDTDLGIRKALAGSTPARALRTAEHWRPWRAYATIHLWQMLADAPALTNPIEEVA